MNMKNKVYIARKENKMRQADVAKKIMMSEKSYQLKESGIRDFTITEAKRLATIYNCTLDDLFGDKESEMSETTNNDNTELIEEITNHLDQVVKLLENKL